MILGVVLGGNLVADTAGHGHSRKSGGTDQRIDFLLADEIHALHHEDTGGDGQCKSQEPQSQCRWSAS